jgi:hypothetical protein
MASISAVANHGRRAELTPRSPRRSLDLRDVGRGRRHCASLLSARLRRQAQRGAPPRGHVHHVASFCPSGSAADVSVEATTDTALRRFTCTGGGGDFSARIAPLPAEHGGTGVWQIVEGTGPLADLRGKGTWTSTRLSGRPDDPATITFRSTWEGVAALDVSPPATGVTSASARKLKRPKGTYTMRVVLSLTDNGGDLVSYVLQAADPREPRNTLIYKLGQTTSGSAALTFRVKPARGTHAIRVEVVATDAVGNEASATKLLRLR